MSDNVHPSNPKTWADAFDAGDSNARLIFDFPLIQILPVITDPAKPSADRWALVSEEPLPGLEPAMARLQKGDQIPVYAAPGEGLDVALLAQRVRWRDSENPADKPTKHMRLNTKSQVQILAALLPSSGELPELVTLTARSSRARYLSAGLTLAHKLSTRGKAMSGRLLPTYMWRLRMSVGQGVELKSTRHTWTVRPYQWAMVGSTLDESALVPEYTEMYTAIRDAWRNVGPDWVDAWSTSVDDRVPDRADDDRPDQADDEQSSATSAAAEAEARDQAAAEAALAAKRARVAELAALAADPATRAVDRRKANAEHAALVEQLRAAGAL